MSKVLRDEADEPERPVDLSARACKARQSTPAVDRDAPDVVLCVAGFRKRDGQHAVFEGGGCFVLIDALQRYSPFEPAKIPFTEATILIFRFRFLFARNRKHPVGDIQADVLFLQSRQLGGDAHLLVGLVDFDLRPRLGLIQTARGQSLEIRRRTYDSFRDAAPGTDERRRSVARCCGPGCSRE